MIIRNVRLVDVEQQIVRNNADISIDGDRFGEVRIDVAADEYARDDTSDVVDGSGFTALPGLINCHVHLAYSGEPNPISRAQLAPAEEAVRAASNALQTLVSGVTTVRDCGSRTGAPIALAAEIAKGALPGPRIIPCGRAITMTGGHGHWFAHEADGEDGVRRAVREQLKLGAQWVKAIATGGVLTPGTTIGAASFSPAEMDALTEEAARHGRKVAAHAIGTTGIINAVRSGVASIEHGSYLNEEAIELMLERGTSHVPTLSAYHRVVTADKDSGIPREAVDKARSACEANLDSFTRSHAAGVNVAAGTDAGTPFNFHGGLGLEVSIMIGAGVDPLAALRICTLQAARNLGLEQSLGSITPGKQADLVLTSADPLTTPEALDTPAVVIQAGSVVGRDGQLTHGTGWGESSPFVKETR